MHDNVVVITGAASGIGAAAAEAFADQGASLALLDRDEATLQKLSRALCKRGIHVRTVAVDLSTEQGVTEGIQNVLVAFSHIDVLLSNINILFKGPFEGLPIEQRKTLFAINLFSHAGTIQTVLPVMKQQGNRTIILAGSDQGLQPDAGLSSYAAAKAGLHSLTKTLARELALSGIQINAIALGMTRTPLVHQLMQSYAQEFDTEVMTVELIPFLIC